MADQRVTNLAEAFVKYIPRDTRFLFACVERGGSVTTIWTIQDPGARVEFLERLLKRAEEEEKREVKRELNDRTRGTRRMKGGRRDGSS